MRHASLHKMSFNELLIKRLKSNIKFMRAQADSAKRFSEQFKAEGNVSLAGIAYDQYCELLAEYEAMEIRLSKLEAQ